MYWSFHNKQDEYREREKERASKEIERGREQPKRERATMQAYKGGKIKCDKSKVMHYKKIRW